MDEPEIIALQLTRRSRFWFLAGAILLALLGIYGVVQFDSTGPQSGDSDAGTVSAIGLCAIFLCAFLLWRMSRRGMGELRIDATGIVIDTSIYLGRVTWENYEKAAIFKRFRQNELGIAVKDAKAFLDTKNGLAGHHSLDMTLIKYGNAAASLYPPKGMEIAARLVGYTPYPTSGKDEDILAWNRENLGYDLPLAVIGVANAADLPARIEKHRPAITAPAALATPAPAASPEFKTCPQCAEQVRAAAKICRFCHYNFETGSMPL